MTVMQKASKTLKKILKVSKVDKRTAVQMTRIHRAEMEEIFLRQFRILEEKVESYIEGLRCLEVDYGKNFYNEADIKTLKAQEPWTKKTLDELKYMLEKLKKLL